jgi:hypothetical protein
MQAVASVAKSLENTPIHSLVEFLYGTPERTRVTLAMCLLATAIGVWFDLVNKAAACAI